MRALTYLSANGQDLGVEIHIAYLPRESRTYLACISQDLGGEMLFSTRIAFSGTHRCCLTLNLTLRASLPITLAPTLTLNLSLARHAFIAAAA